ncbi:hypothetical protein T03_12571 [Trichinella britovi]|uniref:Uncharacterized protein n=1 Tax=Trichinella britovi TaxID=45882 RepID=A0A0V1DBG3_TRIBR|nr:hypothetical protein T03_12571 [Trichinella britovi]
MMHPRPAYPKSIHNVATFYQSIYYSLLAVYPPHTYLHQFREEYPPTTLPPPTQSCEPHRHFLHQSLCHSYPPTPVHHPSISVYLPSTHSTSDSTIYTPPASVPRYLNPPRISSISS